MFRIRSSSFMIHFVLLFSFGSFALRTSNTTTHDQDALLAFKAHITRDPLNILSNWSSSMSVCSWIGVTCGKKHRRVTVLDLSHQGLLGTIPPHLGNLSFLTHISLDNNSFRGFLPNELAKLRKVRSFNFSNDYLSGKIPTWIGSFTQLQVLSLNSNNFTGSIPTSICNLSNLAALDLSINMLSGSIPEKISTLASLKELLLHHNRLSGFIPLGVFNVSSMQKINMRNNFLSGSIPTPIANMTSLNFLSFNFNNLTGALPTNLFSYFPTLKVLMFARNMLYGQIPSSLILCSQLQALSLSYNYFNGKIPNEIGNLSMLRELYLGMNNLSGAEIPLSIGNLVRLEMLSIRRSSLIGSIPSTLGNLTLLRVLDLRDNNLTGNIPAEVSNLINLEQLGLGINSISGPIPFGIFNNSNLRWLMLAVNHLSNELPPSTGLHLPYLGEFLIGENELSGSLPTYISNASEIYIIDVNSNALSGHIPPELGNLRYLQWLNLGYNNFTTESFSSVLSSLTSCKDLRVLQLNGNQLRGDLPSTIGNFSSLEQFLASSCKLRGTLPPQLGNLTNLMQLELSNNPITGSIPTIIGDLHNIQLLSLAGGRLQGNLPSELCRLQRLNYLSLGGNHLSGPIPSCLGNMVALRTLSLKSNNFVSSIPLTLWTLSDILEVDLSSNSLTGTLTPAMENMKALMSLDLSLNKLSSHIPSNIGGLKNLVNLSLASNNLEGLIPESVGDMISLQFLDLSINSLSGELPKSLEKLLHLNYFNVSFNNLKGEIPIGGPFINFSIQSFLGNEGLCGPITFATRRCKNRSRHGNGLGLKYVLLLAIGSPILVLALFIVFLRFRMKNVRQPVQQHNGLSSLATMRFVSVHELTQATNGFEETNLLGTGSFGSVYKGILSDGANIAVKVFNLQRQEANKSFDVECEVLRSIRHRNLVKIITGCSTIDFKALVLEFMPNGSLDKWLHSHNYFLNFLQRLNILIDVASALDYLHHGHHIPVVHCDLKPNNVLLDQEMVAHVGDFGIAKLLGEGNEVVQTVTLATIGYMAPEYGLGGIVSIKCDIYSYGILLIETFTRKRPTSEAFTSELSMIDWIEEAIYTDNVVQVVDANLLNTDEQNVEAKVECASSMLALALKCCAKLPEERIDIKDALNSINKIKHKFLININRAK